MSGKLFIIRKSSVSKVVVSKKQTFLGLFEQPFFDFKAFFLTKNQNDEY